ncbi:MAG TPA: PPK2 family polyphosphate kinase [Acidimicrobiales bacterium]|jgi:PPK2 family polyphosphate:nucleotide phosphotransferase
MGDARAAWIGDLVGALRVRPGTRVAVPEDFDPAFKPGFVAKGDRTALLAESVRLLASSEKRLAAEGTNGVLLCLQGLDGSGKDSTIRHVMSGVSPQGVHVNSFKTPSDEERTHDYLWRHARRLPARGEIGIFNRSHYEEVLVVRVHPALLENEHLPADAQAGDMWQRRYREINDWERYLSENGIRVLKVLLNISKEKQRTRFLRRLDLPDHSWKFSAADIRERGYWNDYQDAFSEMLSATSTDWAPWYVVPADRKWFAHVCVSAVLVHALADIDPQYPDIGADEERAEHLARERLLGEVLGNAPTGG